MQDNSGLYFIVGAIVVAVGAIVFFNYNGSGGYSSTATSTPSVIERNNTYVEKPAAEHNTTIVNPPAEQHTTIVNPPSEEPKRDINIDINRR